MSMLRPSDTPSGPIRHEFATPARSSISSGSPAAMQLAGGQHESQQASKMTRRPVRFSALEKFLYCRIAAVPAGLPEHGPLSSLRNLHVDSAA